METAKLKKFAQLARRSLMEQVSAKLRWVLSDDSAARREQPQAVADIERQIFGDAGKLPDNHKPTVDDLQRQLRLIERVAYIWFNRFCALRFMDVNRYTRIGVVSPAEGQFQPEILAEAKMGHIDPDLVPEKKRQQIFALLDGQAPSRDPQGEAYRLLLVATCNYWHKAMPFLFQRIDDYTELLMPDDLLSAGSILAATREAMTPDVCGVASDQWPVASKENSCHQSLATSHSNAGGVEVIGWLYQFYISEKKDEVFEGLKKNKKITPENIPAATQLFTPHWIVRYLVENSLGRLWLLNRPGSKLIERMDYYIKPEQTETDFLRIGKPEEIKICDPACGSGHMLTYAFDLLYAIYEEEGYEPAEIPEKILTHNLYGIEIDERAGELAAFALIMKAVQYDKRFFRRSAARGGLVKPNICVLDNIYVKTADLLEHLELYDLLHPRKLADRFFEEHPSTPLIRSSFKEILGEFESGFNYLKHNPASTSIIAKLDKQIKETLNLFEAVLDNHNACLSANKILNRTRDALGAKDFNLLLKDIKSELIQLGLSDEIKKWVLLNLSQISTKTQLNDCIQILNKAQGLLTEIGAHPELLNRLKLLGSVIANNARTISQIRATLFQFEEADNFGSLIRPDLTDVDGMLRILESKDVSGDLFLSLIHQRVLQALRQADYLSTKYHVVIANPPYMGGKGMNGLLKSFMSNKYPDVKADLFSAFIVRILELAQKSALMGLMTPFNWMFLGAFEKLRNIIFTTSTITSLVRPEFHAFFDSAYVSICGFTLHALPDESRKAPYFDLQRFYGADLQPVKFLEAINNYGCGWVYSSSISEFKKIPGAPIVYWLGPNSTRLFLKDNIAIKYQVGSGLSTSDNERFVRFIWEVSRANIASDVVSCESSALRDEKWYLFQKGGEFRKWFGNLSHVVNWKTDGKEIKQWVTNNPKDPDTTHWSRRIFNTELYFQEGLTWSTISSGKISFRLAEVGTMISNAAGGIFGFKSQSELVKISLGLNNNIWTMLIGVLNPTLNYSAGIIQKTPVPDISVGIDGESLLTFARYDWDNYETSWDFKILPLLNPDYRQPTLKATYQKLRTHWREMTLEMQRLEEENNRIFIKAYGLQDELTPEVPLNEITLTCNPHYRYGGDKAEDELEALLLADTLRELVSYAVGCMFGRYSLDKTGLILANQGETVADFVRRVASDQWPVASKEGENHERETLQGSDPLAEGHGFGGAGISSDKTISERGALRANQSGAAGSGLDSVQHSGGASEAIGSGVQKLSLDSKGIAGRSGNTIADSNAAGVSESRPANVNHGIASGSQQNDSSLDVRTGHWPLTTSHLSFVPDEDNVIPMLDGTWFTDDIVERFRKFLRVAFGEEHYEDNLRFVEQGLNLKGRRNYGIRDYFLGEFYNDHVKRYRKRPIYWLFSSPKGTFNALIYLHRYRPDTVSVVLNDYLREFHTKLSVHKNHLQAISISAIAGQGEKTRALKEIEKVSQMIAELEEYEREVLYPLATERLAIDLDDGVKVNYPKFGAALKKIVGLDAAEE